jgi:hypothetical protein
MNLIMPPPLIAKYIINTKTIWYDFLIF